MGENVSGDLTAGELASITGLSATAIRLYTERGILTPAAVDGESGHRCYPRSQIQRGLMVDLLQRAQVPLSELRSASEFPFQRWRRTVEVRRHFEDFSLAVAERVSTFDPADFTAHSSPAPAVDWVGIIIDLEIPEDAEGMIQTFAGLAAEFPAVDIAFREALAELDVAPAEISWTASADPAEGGTVGQMLLARPGPAHLGDALRELIAGRVRSATGRDVLVVSGTLPRRDEITFTAAADRGSTPVEEAASGYLQQLAFEVHLTRHRLTAITPTCRQVSHHASMSSGYGDDEPISVFDVHPLAREDSPS